MSTVEIDEETVKDIDELLGYLKVRGDIRNSEMRDKTLRARKEVKEARFT